MSDMLTPDECFALDQTPPAIVELIRYRLENPAEGGHKHHLLAIGRRQSSIRNFWSRTLGRTLTIDQIPVVSVTGPEHYQIHFEMARHYRERGSKGRFSVHALAFTVLSQFAEMSESEWEQHREMVKDAAQIRSDDPEWKTAHKTAVQELAKTAEWRAKTKEATQKSWAENVTRRENHKAAMQSLHTDPAYQTAHKAAVQARSKDPEWRRKQKLGAQAKANDPEWAKRNRIMLQALANRPGFHVKTKLAQQALYSDVIVTFPDGQEKTFGSQGDVARNLGVCRASIGNYLNGKTKTFRGPLKGYSFRYAA